MGWGFEGSCCRPAGASGFETKGFYDKPGVQYDYDHGYDAFHCYYGGPAYAGTGIRNYDLCLLRALQKWRVSMGDDSGMNNPQKDPLIVPMHMVDR